MSGVVMVEAPETEQVEAVAEASVEVAAIEAEARVEIAAIEAETTVAAIEAQAEVEVATIERNEAWQMELDALRASQETAVAALSARQMEHEIQISNLTETVTLQAAAIAALTPASPSSETKTRPEPERSEDQGGREEAGPGTGRRKRVWM